MTNDASSKVENQDDSLLLVSGSKGSKENDKNYVKKLSNAILQVFIKHSSVKLRCVGAASLNNAIKSFIIAKGEASKSGDTLFLDPSFTTVTFQGEEKTGIVLEVVCKEELD
jgi:stage V sporulation protein SpoVS